MLATCPKGEWGASNAGPVRDLVLNTSCACALNTTTSWVPRCRYSSKRRLTKIKTNPTYLLINEGGWLFMEGTRGLLRGGTPRCARAVRLGEWVWWR